MTSRKLNRDKKKKKIDVNNRAQKKLKIKTLPCLLGDEVVIL